MRIAIVDDVELYRDTLAEYVQKCGIEYSLDIQIDCYKDGIEILDAKDIIYDIIYFDIKMNFVDGMEAAKEIRERDAAVLIVFCTNYVQYAIDGYSVNATDFLIKPVSDFAFNEHFKKLLPKLKTNDKKFLLIKSKLGVRKIAYSSIFFLESDGHYIKLVTKSEEITFLETLKNLEKQLENYNFFRCNSCYIVNLAYVNGVVENYVEVENHKLQISRSRKKMFLEALTNFVGDDV